MVCLQVFVSDHGTSEQGQYSYCSLQPRDKENAVVMYEYGFGMSQVLVALFSVVYASKRLQRGGTEASRRLFYTHLAYASVFIILWTAEVCRRLWVWVWVWMWHASYAAADSASLHSALTALRPPLFPQRNLIWHDGLPLQVHQAVALLWQAQGLFVAIIRCGGRVFLIFLFARLCERQSKRQQRAHRLLSCIQIV